MKTFIKLDDRNVITKLYFVVENDKYKMSLGNAIEVEYDKLVRYISRDISVLSEDSRSNIPPLDESIIGAYFNLDEYNSI